MEFYLSGELIEFIYFTLFLNDVFVIFITLYFCDNVFKN